ncbi:hypothetical protein DL96DRAFT_1624761 [Flagelloscypha sp. PMI_526]|nr:hypothetical protein DL96DRAFT_1624761 [Flagelloscypha sp. PMI_526]
MSRRSSRIHTVGTVGLPTKTTKRVKLRFGSAGLLDDQHGLLGNMFNLFPLDIVLEVFSHVDLEDLMSLSRVSRQLKSTLFAPSARRVWKIVRENTDGPAEYPKPDSMPEPVYASLLYDTYCTECFGDNGAWYLATRRFCHGCFESRYCSEDYLQQHVRSTKDRISLNKLRTSWYTLGDALVSPRNQTNSISMFPLREAERLLYEYAHLSEDTREDWLAKKCKEANAKQKIADAFALWRHNLKFHKERELVALRRDAIRENLRELGWGEEIDCYEASVRNPWLSCHEQIRDFSAPFRLTSKSWNRMQPALISFMEELKVKRLEKEYKQHEAVRFKKLCLYVDSHKGELPEGATHQTILRGLLPFARMLSAEPIADPISEETFQSLWPSIPVMLEQRRRAQLISSSRKAIILSQPVGTIIPLPGDLFLLEPFVALLRLTPLDHHIDLEPLLKAAWKGFLPSLREWQLGQCQKLLGLSPVLKSESDLHLAKTAFHCTRCDTNNIRYPRIIVHDCPQNTSSKTSSKSLTPNKSFSTSKLFSPILSDLPVDIGDACFAARQYPWSTTNLRLCDNPLRTVLIDKIPRLNPSTAKYDDIIALNPLFECTTCQSEITERRGFGYDAAFTYSHNHLHHKKNKPPRFRFIPIRERESFGLSWPTPRPPLTTTSQYQSFFYCRHCGADCPRCALGDHMRTK